MESPAARLLDLLSALQARPHWTAAELAERLGTTTRTVRRDVTRLRELGYPVDAELGRTGGYTLGNGGALPPLLLTDDEAVAVAIGLRVAASSGGVSGDDDAAVAALAKLEQVLPARLRERVLALNTAAVLVRRGPMGPMVDPDVLLLLAQGCRRPERLHFRYVDGSGRASERRTEPYRLVQAECRWYLVARDLTRDAWRTFRVDRMSEPVLTGHRFAHAAEPDAAAMVIEGIAFATYERAAEIVLHVPIEEAAREIPLTIGTVDVHESGGTLLRIAANDLDWIARYLAGLPFPITVLDPPELRAELRKVAKRLNAAAKSQLGAADRSMLG